MEKTKQATHTPEPWYEDSQRWSCGTHHESRILNGPAATPQFAGTIATCDSCGDNNDVANAARIVACVNALAGVGDPKSYSVAMRELVEAAGGIFALKGFKHNSGQEFTRLRSALAAVKST